MYVFCEMEVTAAALAMKATTVHDGKEQFGARLARASGGGEFRALFVNDDPTIYGENRPLDPFSSL
jgi:hypothetical protein